MEGGMSVSFFQSAANCDGIADVEGYPPSSEDICILGEKYRLPIDREELEKDVQSRLLLTYRKGFGAIGGTGPTSDFGWGCMLRCGQMMLAETLIRRHLSRDWRWIRHSMDVKYLQILQMFLDRKDSCYSIHQIASMGVSEGKAVGEWFGPNTISQVLRKLAVYDSWSDLVIHIAMDNCIVIDDIYQLCMSDETSMELDASQNNRLDDIRSCSAAAADCCQPVNCECSELLNSVSSCKRLHSGWRPLLLIIPMRLGLSDVNSIYFSAVKKCFTVRQSVGIIGGKPNNAFWFIGCTENKLFYLDPHRLQFVADFMNEVDVTDESYHTVNPSYMDITQLDPSIAFGFYCSCREDLDDLCQSLQQVTVTDSRCSPLLEVHSTRPAHFPPVQLYAPDVATASAMTEFTLLDENRVMDSDDEFEILM